MVVIKPTYNTNTVTIHSGSARSDVVLSTLTHPQKNKILGLVCLTAAANQIGASLSVTSSASVPGAYVESIGTVKENGNFGWKFWVNGKEIEDSIDEVSLENQDHLEARYTGPGPKPK